MAAAPLREGAERGGSAPEGHVELREGVTGTLVGLKGRADLNGLRCTLLAPLIAESGRVPVRVIKPGDGTEEVLLKPANLDALREPEVTDVMEEEEHGAAPEDAGQGAEHVAVAATPAAGDDAEERMRGVRT